jgi:phenylalanyl-tRNA synthetase beta chain
VAKNFDLGETYAVEIDFMTLMDCRAPESGYKPLPRFPAVSRDIALVCDTSVTVAALTNCIKRGGGALLREVELFDIYTGSQVPQGKKSVAFSLKLRSDDQTLTDEHADEATKSILALLENELGAVIR